MCGVTGAIVGGAIIAGGAGIAGSMIQSSAATSAGNAQVSSAQLQVQMQQQALQAEIAARQQAMTQIQGISGIQPNELASINQILTTSQAALNTSLASVNQQQQQVNAMAPQVGQAGQDLYNLLSGQQSAILAPLQQQQTNARQNLINQLQSQMGPGFMTSTAGIQALTAFDQQSAVTNAQAQQNAIGTATAAYSQTAGLQLQGQNAIGSQINAAYGQQQAANTFASQSYQNINARGVSAALGVMNANPIGYTGPANAQNNVTNVAGNPFSGQSITGQGIGSAGGSIGGGLAGAGVIGALGNGTASSSSYGNSFGSAGSQTIAGYNNGITTPTFGSSLGGGSGSGLGY